MSRYLILAAVVVMCSALAQGVTLTFNAAAIAPGQTATLQAPGGPVYSATFDADNVLVDKINAVITKWNGMNLSDYADGAVTLVLNVANGVAPGEIATIDDGALARDYTLDETTIGQIVEIIQDYFHMNPADLQ